MMKSPLTKQLLVIFFLKLLLNTCHRFVYPFAPALSRDLNVSLSAITTIIATGKFLGLLGLFSGPIADKVGNRLMIHFSLAVIAFGMLICGITLEYWFVFFGLNIAFFGFAVFSPAIHSFLGNNVPSNRRGRVIGVVETAWAISTLIGVPILGLIIDYLGFRASFLILAIFCGVSWVVAARVIPSDTLAIEDKGTITGTFVSIRKLFQLQSTTGMLAFRFWTSMASGIFYAVYGIWLEQEFAVSIVMLGFSTITIGGAELLGTSVTVILGDLVGQNRLLFIGISLTIIAYLLLPLASGSLISAMIAIFFIFLFLETTIVSSLILSTELMPHARSTMMAGLYTTSGIGQMIGVLIGGLAWGYGGVQTVSLGAAGLTCLSLLSLLWGVRNWEYKL